MSANCHAASGIVDWPSAPLGLAPSRRFGGHHSALRPVATALTRLRLLFDALKKPRRNKPQPPPPEEFGEHSDSDSIWDDPALWMLMMH